VEIRHRKLHLPLVFPMYEILYCKQNAFVHIPRTSLLAADNWPSSASRHNVHLFCLLILMATFILGKQYSNASALHHEAMWWVEAQLHIFLISALNGGKGLAFLCVLDRASSWYLNKGRPTWCHFDLLCQFTAQHVSDFNTTIFRSLRLLGVLLHRLCCDVMIEVYVLIYLYIYIKHLPLDKYINIYNTYH